MKKLKSEYDVVLFDLDGTLSQSALGIRHSLEYALSQIGKTDIDLSDYSIYIGPPLLHTLTNYCKLNDDDAVKAFDFYVSHYNEKGKYENRLYNGIKELLIDLKSAGAKTVVCTSKYEGFANEIAEILGIKELFDAVCGATLDGKRKEKADIIPYALKTVNADISCKAVMIGDTFFDAKGAETAGVDFIGALYGYGNKESMQRYNADKFAESADDLRKYLFC